MKNEKSLLAQATTHKNLRLAWEEIADNKGMPGVDHVSIKKWRRNWEERIVRLSDQVRANTYKPKPLRVRKFLKRNRREWRVIRIPTVTDRVLQRAVLQVLYPILEDQFLSCSFGYRPGIGLKDAVERILVHRVNDYWWVLDADIDDFFNQVDHALLMEFLHEDLPDKSLFQLFRSWLEISRPNPKEDKGIPMGSPVSSAFANIFLHRLDQNILNDSYEVVRYADDFLVFTQTEEELLQAYQRVENHLSDLKLIYEPTKTRMTSFKKGFNFIGVWFQGESYEYVHKNKRIEVQGDKADWLFQQYGPDYE